MFLFLLVSCRPFCSMNNTLQIEMETSTAAGNEAKPIHSDQSEDGEQGEQAAHCVRSSSISPCEGVCTAATVYLCTACTLFPSCCHQPSLLQGPSVLMRLLPWCHLDRRCP